MDSGTLVVGEGVVSGRSVGLRITTVVAALALVFAAFVLVQGRADAAPADAGAAVAASVAQAPGASSVSPQIGDFTALFCPILLSLRASFGVFGSIFDAFLAAFGCTAAVPSAS